MSAPPYMRWFPGDYARDTVHLTRGEHGAYRLLIDAMWSAGGKLPSDETKLARLAMCSPSEWAECRETILAFFQVRGAHLTQKRIAREIAHYKSVSLKRKKAGKLGGKPTHGKDKASGVPIGKQLLHNQNQNQTPIGASIKDAPNRRRGAALSLVGSEARPAPTEQEIEERTLIAFRAEEARNKERRAVGAQMRALADELKGKRP